MTGRQRWLGRFFLAAATAALGGIGYALLWSTFMVYDDEGYVLHSLRSFSDHGHLYTQVYTQYGPFFFVCFRALHWLGLEFTNTAGREIALCCWLGTAVVCAATVSRHVKGSFVAVFGTLVAVFLHLTAMDAEPSHPGGLIALLVATAAWCATARAPAARFVPAAHGGTDANATAPDSGNDAPRCFLDTKYAITAGLLVAALVLTKINVGILLGVAIGAAWVLHSPAALRPTIRWLIALGLVLVPVALMWGSRGEAWISIYALVVAIGGITVVWATPPPAGTAFRPRVAVAAISAAVGLAVVVVVAVNRAGTPLAAILDGVVLGPLRHPSVYWVPLHWRPGTVAIALISAVAAFVCSRAPLRTRTPYIATARLALALGYTLALAGLLPCTAPAFVMCYGVSCAWLFVISCTLDDRTRLTRMVLALLLVLQSLHAFPVAGSQLSWGTFLWPALAALGLVELAPLWSRSARRIFSLGVLVAGMVLIAKTASVARAQMEASDRLRLNGAENLELPESLSTALRMLVRNTQIHADLLFTFPGMMSFNAWTGVPPPTLANATHWFNLLSPEQQEAIQQRLNADPRSVVIVQRYVRDFLESGHFIHPNALITWLKANYESAFRVETYDFWVRKGRAIAPVNSATLLRGAPGAPTKLKVHVVLAPLASIRIAAVALRPLDAAGEPPLAVWTSANARFVSAPITPSGATTAPKSECHLPCAITGMTAFDIFTDVFPSTFNSARAVVYFYDENGARVGEARFIN